MFGQQRSQSGPGGLSINTGSANQFGKSSQPPPASGLFGATKPSTSLFGSSNNTPQPQQATSIFGASTSNQTGGLFGSQPANNPQQQGGGLFGGQSTNSQPQQSGGLFGSQPAQQKSGGSLFGPTSQQAQPQQNSSVFGSLGNQNQAQQTQQGGGLLAGLNAQNKAFGSTGQNQSANQSLFLTASQKNPVPQQRPLFSSSIGQYSQAQQTIPGVRIDISQLRGTTRFNDLIEDLQKVIENVDSTIAAQMAFSDQCEEALPRIESTFSYMPDDVEFCSTKLQTMQRALEIDAESIDDVKAITRKDASNARLSFRVVQNLKMPQQFHHAGLWSSSAVSQSVVDEDVREAASPDLVSYFSQQADGMAKVLENYKRHVTEVETYLKGLEANTLQQIQQVQFTRTQDGSQRSGDDQVRELAAVLREFENGIMGVAGKVGSTREKVQEVILDKNQQNSRSRRPGVI